MQLVNSIHEVYLGHYTTRRNGVPQIINRFFPESALLNFDSKIIVMESTQNLQDLLIMLTIVPSKDQYIILIYPYAGKVFIIYSLRLVEKLKALTPGLKGAWQSERC